MHGKTRSNSLARVAGLGVLLWVEGFSLPAYAEKALLDFNSPCYTGYSTHPSNENLVDEYVEEGQLARVQPAISDWLNEQRWNDKYARWQRSLRCDFGFAKSSFYGDAKLCAEQTKVDGNHFSGGAQQGARSFCSSKQNSLKFMAMHKHLLQGVRALWPSLEHQFDAWMMLPEEEDYPASTQSVFNAWPDKVRRHAMLLTSMKSMSDREVFLRWPNEGDFVHWMLCGSTESGMSVDALYGALMSNLIESVDPASDHPKLQLEQFLFWKVHAWLEMHWNRYRLRKQLTPLEPELQAEMIKQCEVFENTKKTFKSSSIAKSLKAHFKYGQLNPENVGQRIRIVGKVKEIIQLAGGHNIYRIEWPLMGVEPAWLSTHSPVKTGEILEGSSYQFIALLTKTKTLDTSGKLQKIVNSDLMLMAESIQSLK